MNEQEVFLRVGELAGRVGYPMPSVTQVECKEGEECVSLRPNDQGGTTLALHEGFQDRYPAAVWDFLIAQALVQARRGAFQRWRRMQVARSVWGFLIAIGMVLICGQLIEPVWLALFVSVAVAYPVLLAVNLLSATFVIRWAVRRADRELIELLGRPQVVEALEWYSVKYPATFSFRWIWQGAPPFPRERLRLLGAVA